MSSLGIDDDIQRDIERAREYVGTVRIAHGVRAAAMMTRVIDRAEKAEAELRAEVKRLQKVVD